MVLSVAVVVDIIDEAESPIILVESAPIAVESAPIVVVMVESDVEVSSVLGLLWQAAKVRVLPINRSAVIFFITRFGGCL